MGGRQVDQSIFAKTFINIYLPDGIKAIELLNKSYQAREKRLHCHGELNETLKLELEQTRKHLNNIWVALASFFGLPNKLRKKKPCGLNDFSFLDIIKNFLGWNEEISVAVNISKCIIKCIIPVYIMKIVFIVFKCLINIVRIFTEFFPKYFDELCIAGIDYANKNNHALLKILASTGSLLFTGLTFILRAVTSPMQNILLTWNRIKNISYGRGRSKIGFINILFKGNYCVATGVGISLAFLSAAITITMAIILLPLTLKWCGAYLWSHAPKLITNLFSTINFVANHFGFGLSSVLGKTGMTVAFTQQLGASVITGLSVISCLSVQYFVSKIKNIFNSNIKPNFSLTEEIKKCWKMFWQKKPMLNSNFSTPNCSENKISFISPSQSVHAFLCKINIGRNTADMEKIINQSGQHTRISTEVTELSNQTHVSKECNGFPEKAGASLTNLGLYAPT